MADPPSFGRPFGCARPAVSPSTALTGPAPAAPTDDRLVAAETVVEVDDELVTVDFVRNDLRAAVFPVVERDAVVDSADDPTAGVIGPDAGTVDVEPAPAPEPEPTP